MKVKATDVPKIIALAIFLVTSANAQPTKIEPAPLLHARGAVPPKNLKLVSDAQQETYRISSMVLQSSPLRPGAPRPICIASASSFDWNAIGKVTDAQDQGSCGSCWAFASIAAYESSYLIENGLTKTSPRAASASEQEALDCVSPENTCRGGWHNKVFDWLASHGDTTKTAYPYSQYPAVPSQGICRNVPSQYFAALPWNFIAGATIPTDAQMKAAICEYGPIVAAVNSARWDTLTADGKHYLYSTENPNWLKDYPNGVLKGEPSRPNLTMVNIQKGDVDHDVLIVGWDDKAKAWTIKNSWGKHWGNSGFMKLAYGTANIGFNAAWVQARPPVVNAVSAAIFERLQSINRGFKSDYLKSLTSTH